MIRPPLAFILAVAPLTLLAQAPKPDIPDYSQAARATIPEALTWKVTDLFPTEAAWRTEFEELKKLAATVDTLSKGWMNSPKSTADLMERVAEINKRARRLFAYTSFQSDTDLAEARFQKLKGEAQTFLVNFGAKLAFMESDVLKLGKEKAEAYFKAEPRLAPFRFGFEQTLRAKDHVLPEKEQRIASMTGLFAGTASKTSGLLNNVDLPRAEVTLKQGGKVLLNTANFQRYRAAKDPEDRRKVMETYFTNVKRFENTFASLMDGNIKNNRFNAQIRNHKTDLEAALFENAVDTTVYRNLISTVRANLGPLHRLLKLRQKMLGLPEFHYGDIYASAVASVNRTYPYPEGQKLIFEAMKPLGGDYTQALQRAFSERWIDVYPNKGKRSGAYSGNVFGVHPYVLMNFDGSYRDVSTLAHELGHAMHSYFADQTQPFPTADYPIFLAEVASTFNEKLLMDFMLKTEKDDRFKLYLLDQYLEGLRGTVYRQTLFAEFELAMHERVEQGQTLTPDWLNAKYLDLTRHYYGHDLGVVKVDDYIQIEWASVPHFYRNFYVYQYATGAVASMALADAVTKEGAAARDRYLGFLKAGGSDFPLNILKKAGVDMASPKPVEATMKTFERLVSEMEAIQARLENAGK